MVDIRRYSQNPILAANKKNRWENQAVFNGCIVGKKGKFHFLYRAVSSAQIYYGKSLELSSIGYAQGFDGINFTNRRLFITPEYKWEQFGCEDPRVTNLGDKYYIFYTALANYPPAPEDIKIGLAITRDFQKIEEEHQVTHFNSKAMALFPEKISGKIVAVLTVNTDRPPSKIALAFFEKEEQIWSKDFWDYWLPLHEKYVLPLQRDPNDHVEVGAPPVKTEKGWLLIYCYIQNYLSFPKIFGIEAILLDLKNPLTIIGRTTEPLLVPEEEYELYGKVPNVIFPSGAMVEGDQLNIYYGAADTTCCLATVGLEDLIEEMMPNKQIIVLGSRKKRVKLTRFSGNPIIKPRPENSWEAKSTFNPGAIREADKVHLVYRAMSENNTSVFGYAASKDGLYIDERLDNPIYLPREEFEQKVQPGNFNSGCEDPRITKIEDEFYICYTAFDGQGPTRIALTSVKVEDFVSKKWNWTRAKIISAPDRSDKNGALLPEKIDNKFIFFHRIGGCIWIDSLEDLNFGEKHWLGGKIILSPRTDKWDSNKVGVAAPPLKTSYGWLTIYHALSTHDDMYRLGAILLDGKNPDKVLGRLDYPILEPETDYEKEGLRPNTVFSCGAVVIKDRLFVYYGAADQVVAVASVSLDKLLKAFRPLA